MVTCDRCARLKSRLILASQSPARARLLKKLVRVLYPQVRIVIKPAHLDERSHLRTIFGSGQPDLKKARAMARALAIAKSKAQAAVDPVLGSDQLLFLPGRGLARGEILGKPGSKKRALQMLKKCSGREAYLVTSIALTFRKNGAKSARGLKASESVRKTTIVRTQVTSLRFATLANAHLERILRLDHPYNCAGSFMFERHGALLFESVRTDDPTGIEGLPIMRAHSILKAAKIFA